MIKLTEEEKNWIRENLEEPEKLINSDDVNDLLTEIDYYMGMNCYDMPGHEFTDEGRMIEKMYDHIFDNN